MQAPSIQVPPPNPLVVQAEQQAQQELVSGLQTQSRSDTASLMSQYGALASATGAAPSSQSPSATIAGR